MMNAKAYHDHPGKPWEDAANDDKRGGARPEEQPASPLIEAKEWKWIEPEAIKPRQWIYGWHYQRLFVSTTIAPGGLGKTSNSMVEAVAIATGRELLDER